MTDATLASRSPHRTSTLANLAGAFAASIGALLREWHRRSRSRWELSTYSYDERADLGFAPELDAELTKPFWRK
jgi:uncharacterized protein YjiS (DUF1127 family)